MISLYTLHPDMQKRVRVFLICIAINLVAICVHAQERTLDYYINTAAHNSPLLNDYNNQKLANLIDSMRIVAGLKPQVTANSIQNQYEAIRLLHHYTIHYCIRQLGAGCLQYPVAGTAQERRDHPEKR
jgi:hypothetical protein